MTNNLHQRRMAVASVAALVLLLQSFFVSWAAASQPMLDAFGNVLCTTSVEMGEKSPGGDHAQDKNCCTLGCNWASNVLAAPEGDSARIGWPNSAKDYRGPAELSFQPREPDHDPGNPRGPPQTV